MFSKSPQIDDFRCDCCTSFKFLIYISFFMLVVRQRREADAALFSELYRKLGSQVMNI